MRSILVGLESVFCMLLSKLFGKRTKEVPADASLMSHIFLLRGGYIKSLGSGIYSLLTPAVRVKRKIENIIREEMDAIGGQEVSLPVVLPGTLWERSGRLFSVGSELLRFRDRTSRCMLLAMTHEEAVVDLAESFAQTYSDYPFMLYQIQTKFRDEPRARGGLIRLREFTMKDAYSFHLSKEDLKRYYEKMLKVYHNIYKKIGLPEVVCIQSDSGIMGGDVAHEFMLFCDSGEDSIVVCDNCGYKANLEVAESLIPSFDSKKFLDSGKIKVCLYKIKGQEAEVAVFIRVDLSVNESKLQKLVGEQVSYVNNVVIDNLGELSASFFVDPDSNNRIIFIDISLKGICESNDYFDVYEVNEKHFCRCCKSALKVRRGIEVGNIFQLGVKYTKRMKVTYQAKDNHRDFAIMGCYGIGVTRLIASLVEAKHDKFGPIWPKSVCPWQVHICALSFDDTVVRENAIKLHDYLSKKFEVILDDRDLHIGSQFADADLLGIPIRITISKNNAEKDFLEVKFRGEHSSFKVKKSEILKFLDDFYN